MRPKRTGRPCRAWWTDSDRYKKEKAREEKQKLKDRKPQPLWSFDETAHGGIRAWTDCSRSLQVAQLHQRHQPQLPS